MPRSASARAALVRSTACGKGCGSVVETHATPLRNGPDGGPQSRVIEAVIAIMDDLGITLVAHAHGIPMAVPHSRPVGMTVHGTDERLIGEHKPVFGTVQVPASLAALLEMRLGESSRDAVGFSIHVPHYLAQSTFHDAALTALNAIVDVTGLNLPNDALVAKTEENRRAIAAEVEGLLHEG